MSVRIRLLAAIATTVLVLVAMPRASEAVHSLLATPGTPGADLLVTKTGPASATPGSNVSFTVTLTNLGPDDALTVSLTDQVPGGMTFVSETQNTGLTFSCIDPPVGSGGTITCTIATLPQSASATFTFVMNIPSGTPKGTVFTNIASATSATTDPNPDNNAGTAAVRTPEADLIVTKSGPASAVAGSDVPFDVTILNLGPDEAAGVSLADAIPPGMTFVSNTQNNGPTFSCTDPAEGSGGTITCTIATLALNASANFTFVMQIPGSAPAGTTFTNIATASSTGSFDPNDENNSGVSAVTTPGAASADLSASKNGPANAIPDSDVPFSIVITNAGPTAATNVSFSDVLPGNMTFVSIAQNSGPAFNCSSVPASGSGGTVTCTLATMNAGASATFTLTTHIPPGSSGTDYINNVTVGSMTPDPNNENNTGTALVRASAADTSISKSGPATVFAGNAITWQLTLTNVGPGDTAINASFTDQLPSGTTFVSLNHVGGSPPSSCSTPSSGQSGTVTCSVAALASGANSQYELTATVAANVPNGSVINNTVTASSENADPNPNNNSSSFATTVDTSANLAVTKVDSPDPVNAGANLTYTITVTNAGPSDGANLQLSDLLPTNTTLVSFSVPAGWTRTDSVPVGGTGTVMATTPALAPGGSPVFTLVVRVNSSTPVESQITNSATVNSSTFDADEMNNSQSVMTTVSTSADLSLVKTDSPDPVSAGSNVTYSITVANNGVSDANSLNFSDTLPPGTTLVSFTTPPGWSRTDVVPVGGTGTVTATTATLASGANAQFTLVVNVNANTPNSMVIENTANVTSSTSDPDLNNNSSTTTTTVASVPDLTITKSHSGNFSAGQAGASYTITVSNVGTGPTSGLVTVTDNVPVGLTPTGPTGVVNGWTCTINGQTLTCTRSEALAGSASYPAINLTVNVANPAPSNVTNTATVSGGGEVNTGNNTASDPTTISCSQDLSLNNAGPLVISRFRENGPAGPQDEFVEIFNPSTTPHTVASGICSGSGGYGVYASAGNGTTSNTATMVCYIPNGTVIPAGGYYLCTGATYSLGNLGRNGGTAGATATGDAPIGCGGTCGANIPDDAGLVLLNQSQATLSPPGGFNGALEFGIVLYDKVGFEPYGVGAQAPTYPSLAATYCEGSACLKPVGDASTGAACANPTGLFPVFPAPPACYGLAGQYEFLRRQTTFDANLGTLHQDTNNNGNDFILVAPNPAENMGMGITGVFGVTAVLGAAGPYNTNAPPDIPAVKLTRTPFDGTDQLGPLNLERRFLPDPTVANPANNPLGTLTLRYKYTNNSGSPINGLRFEVDNLSTLCGPQTGSATVGTGDARNVGSSPDCGTGSFTAILKALNSVTEVVIDSGGTARTVLGTVLEDLSVGAAPGAGPLSPNGGGIDNTLITNPSSDNATVGDGVTGGVGNFATTVGTTDPSRVMRVKFKFGVVRSGRFILLVVPMAKTTPSP